MAFDCTASAGSGEYCRVSGGVRGGGGGEGGGEGGGGKCIAFMTAIRQLGKLNKNPERLVKSMLPLRQTNANPGELSK